MPVHRLPALAALGSKIGCNKHNDCGPEFACMNNASWALPDAPGVTYVQHDNIPDSENYLPVPRPSVPGFDSFCSCDQTYAWSGYDCTSYDLSWYLDCLYVVMAMILSSIAFFWCVLNARKLLNLANGRLEFNTISQGILIVMLACVAQIAAGSARLKLMSSPLNYVFVPEKDEKWAPASYAYQYITVILGVLSTLSVLHVVSSWIEIVQKMKKMTGMSMRARWSLKAIKGSEIFIFISCTILVSLDLPAIAFGVAIFYLVGVIGCSIYGAYRMNGLLKERVMNGKIINTKSDDGQVKSLFQTIKRCAIRVVVISSIGMLGCLLILTGSMIGVQFESQSPEGGFNRIYNIGSWISINVMCPGLHLVVASYHYSILKSRVARISTATNRKGEEFILSILGDLPSPYLVRFTPQDNGYVPENVDFLDKNKNAEVLQIRNDDEIEGNLSTTTRTIITESTIVLTVQKSSNVFQRIFQHHTYHICILGLTTIVSPITIPIQMGIIQNEYVSLCLLIPLVFGLPALANIFDMDLLKRLLKSPEIWGKFFLLGVVLISGCDVFKWDVRIVAVILLVWIVCLSLLVDCLVLLNMHGKRALILIAFFCVVSELILMFTSSFENIHHSVLILNKTPILSVFGLYRDTLISVLFFMFREMIHILRGKDKTRFNSIFDKVSVSYKTLAQEHAKKHLSRQRFRNLGHPIPERVGASFIQVNSGFLVQDVEHMNQETKHVVVMYCDSVQIKERSLILVLIFGLETGIRFVQILNSNKVKIGAFIAYISALVMSLLGLLHIVSPLMTLTSLVNIIISLASVGQLSWSMVKLILKRIDTIIDLLMVFLWFLASAYIFHFDARVVVHLAILLLFVRFFLQDAHFEYSDSKFRNLIWIMFTMILLFFSALYHFLLIAGKIPNIVSVNINDGSDIVKDTFDPSQFAFSFGLSITIRMISLSYSTLIALQTRTLRDIKRPVCAVQNVATISSPSVVSTRV